MSVASRRLPEQVAPVTDSSGVVLGIVTLGNLMASILNKKVGMGDPVSKVSQARLPLSLYSIRYKYRLSC